MRGVSGEANTPWVGSSQAEPSHNPAAAASRVKKPVSAPVQATSRAEPMPQRSSAPNSIARAQPGVLKNRPCCRLSITAACMAMPGTRLPSGLV